MNDNELGRLYSKIEEIEVHKCKAKVIGQYYVTLDIEGTLNETYTGTNQTVTEKFDLCKEKLIDKINILVDDFKNELNDLDLNLEDDKKISVRTDERLDYYINDREEIKEEEISDMCEKLMTETKIKPKDVYKTLSWEDLKPEIVCKIYNNHFSK